MQNKYFKFLIIILAVACIVPQMASASWWNPASWGIWESIFHFGRQIQKVVIGSEKACVAYGGKVTTTDCYCLGGKDFRNNCLIGGCSCPPNLQFKKQVKDCDCGQGKCWDGVTCVDSNKARGITEDNPIVGNDRDSHGCIGPAGYSWCEAKQKCLRSWEEACEIASDVYPVFGNGNLKWGSATAKTMNEPVTNLAINGYEITATGKINANQDASDFMKYYDSKLKASGWAVDNNFAADGIKGSQAGYKKGNDYIVLSYNITPGKITSNANEPLQWTCPCDVTYSIFTTTPIQPADSTAGWETYTNTQYGFEIKIPNDYIIKQNSDGFDFTTDKLLKLGEQNLENCRQGKNCVSEFINTIGSFRYIKNGDQYLTKKRTSIIQISQIKWTRYEYAGFDIEVHFITIDNQGNGYDFALSFGGSEDIMKQMLSTFKFTK